MFHNKLHADYVTTATLNQLADFIFENNLLNPFIAHLLQLSECQNVMQTLYDCSVLMNDPIQQVSGRLFYNLVVEVEIGDSYYSIREMNPSNSGREEKYQNIILPDMAFLNDEFKRLFVELFESIIKALNAQNMNTAHSHSQKSYFRKSRKSKEKIQPVFSQDRCGQEDTILRSALDDVLLRSSTSFKMMKDNLWTEFLGKLKEIQFNGDVVSLEAFVLKAIQFVMYAHIKNAYQLQCFAVDTTVNTVNADSQSKSSSSCSPRHVKSGAMFSSSDSVLVGKSVMNATTESVYSVKK